MNTLFNKTSEEENVPSTKHWLATHAMIIWCHSLWIINSFHFRAFIYPLFFIYLKPLKTLIDTCIKEKKNTIKPSWRRLKGVRVRLGSHRYRKHKFEWLLSMMDVSSGAQAAAFNENQCKHASIRILGFRVQNVYVHASVLSPVMGFMYKRGGHWSLKVQPVEIFSC